MASSQTLAPYKADFLRASIEGGVLKFGTFELKSGRISPYFFNTGDFYRGDLLQSLSTAYARTVMAAHDSGELDFDLVFGPAYKGIPLAVSTVDKLAQLDPARYGKVCYSFDRKEAKDHGEGGNIVGAPLRGKRVLIVDDVVSAGTAKREAIAKIRAEGGIVAGIVIALDRMEKLPAADGDDAKPGPSAIGELRKEYGIPIISILTLDDIIAGTRGLISDADIQATEAYRAKYKASD
ncbi:phosphoribosyltransferase-like protein [Cercophora scortea]|uniref:Orotate phosphoribosyltransferase n=1 Tax=Cercophora scortea TaxID=314031 RepID=A0AAE0M9F2_9PEZI|nr:phosphoribosyltransferase-like protein [Cercophora scortea]